MYFFRHLKNAVVEYLRHCHHRGAQICWPQRRLPSFRRRPVIHWGTPTLQSVPTIEKQSCVVWTYLSSQSNIFHFELQACIVFEIHSTTFRNNKHNTGLTSRVADLNSHDSVDSLWWESSRRGRGGRCRLPPTLSPPPPPPKYSSDNWNKKDIASSHYLANTSLFLIWSTFTYTVNVHAVRKKPGIYM